MREWKSVVVTTAKPSGPGDLGEVAEGFYFCDGDLLTMCDRDGIPLRDENNGQRITHHLASGESEKAVAKRFTLKIFRMARGDTVAGFDRPLRYGPLGIA
jgi:hypothetical protein